MSAMATPRMSEVMEHMKNALLVSADAVDSVARIEVKMLSNMVVPFGGQW
jgi:hypothetical protein